MDYNRTLSMHHLDKLVQAVKMYLELTLGKCDSPELREARSQLVRCTVLPDVILESIKKSIDISVTHDSGV